MSKHSNILALIFLIWFTKLNCQVNLVPNPSFEEYTMCPFDVSQIAFANRWFSPSTATPDYYNACASPTTNVGVPSNQFGNCYPRSGNGMAGFLNTDGVFGNTSKKFREYLSIKLYSTLLPNVKYFFTFFVRLSDNSRYATNSLGAFFYKDSIFKNYFDTINCMPQINNLSFGFINNKNSWVKLKGNFIASGNEKYLYFGNFHPDVTNDTLFVGPGMPNLGSNFNFPYYYCDDICLSTDSLYSENWVGIKEVEFEKFKFFPNPIVNNLFIQQFDLEDQFKFFDIHGNEKHIQRKADSFDFSDLPNGVYYLTYIKKSKPPHIYKLIKL